jgi:hypothetical protein
MRYLLLVLALALGVVGCGVDSNVEARVQIDQGVYGLLVTGCDPSGCSNMPDRGMNVIVYTPGDSGATSTVQSDDAGVYQVDLDAGDYTLCTSSCTPITVPDGGRIRYDWTGGPGGGQWQPL